MKIKTFGVMGEVLLFLICIAFVILAIILWELWFLFVAGVAWLTRAKFSRMIDEEIRNRRLVGEISRVISQLEEEG